MSRLKKIKDIEELSINMDVVARIAAFALGFSAKNQKIINEVYESSFDLLSEVYDPEKVKKTVELFREASTKSHDFLKQK